MAQKQHSSITGTDLHVPKTHSSSHTDGTDDLQSATSAQKGLATASQIGKLDGIATGADATNATNVAAAGAVMDTDYGLDEIMVGTGVGTHNQITLNASEFLAREGTGNTTNVNAAGARTILNIADGATNYPGVGEQAFLDADHSKLDGIAAGATDDQTGAEIKVAYEAEANTNAFTDTEQTKLTGVETAADVTDATNVGAAGAIMDTDVTPAEGVIRKTGAGAYTAMKTNLAASNAPTVNDDTGDGYVIGSRWIDTTADKEYVCLDITMAAAVWVETTAGASGGEANTSSNSGSGAGLAQTKNGVDLPFKSLTAGTGITLTQNTNDVQITATGSGSGDMTKAVYDPNDDGVIAVGQTEADVTNATSVATAGAVMDSDVSEAEGFMRKTGAGAYEAIKTNMSSATSPTANEDSGDGYAIGSQWFDTTADKGYVCLDATVAAAVWKETTGSGSGIADIVEDTTPQLGGDLDLNGHEILVDTTPGTDHTASGMKGTFTNGNAGSVAFGDVCFMAADGHLEFADADANTTMPGLYMALGTIAAAASGEWLIMGVARDDTWNWTIGAGAAGLIYVSLTGTTANTLTQTAPSATGDQVQIIGTAISADTMMFNPSPVLVEIA